MLGLAHLPPELVLEIISAALPEGFESLALSCKHIYQLCKPLTKHHNLLRRQFHRFEYRRRPPPVLEDPLWRPMGNAFDLLERIAAEPIVARYIRYADLCWDNYPTTHSLTPRVPDREAGSPIVDLFANSPYLKLAGLDWREYYARVAEEYRSTRFSHHAGVFVLTLLPNAKSLLLPRYWKLTEEIDKLIRAIVGVARQRSTPYLSPSLAQLTRFDSNVSSYYGNAVDFIGLRPFLTLPELRTFHGHGSIALDTYGPSQASFVETLEHAYMTSCCIDEVAMAAFLRSNKRLKTLVYSHSTPEDAPRRELDVCSFLRLIEREAGSQLERLCFEAYTTHLAPIPGIMSLKQFPRLRQLVLPLNSFHCHLSHAASRASKSVDDLTEEDAETLGLRLGDLVPVSVTELTLLSAGQVPHDKVLEVLFSGFTATKAARFRNLEHIILACQTDFDPDTEPTPAYRARCESLVGG
ncbi:hypothetical protein PG985_009646 [Apiospora marii]|uniref:F-box domain-containing protein n=1 Tax=Apiospora marii TaxID=335849 RepID=A0ABR1RFW9_9PEZI